MATYDWPHAHLPHALRDSLMAATLADARIYTATPRERTYPLLVIQPAGLGMIGLDSTIQADQPRVQVDSWAETKMQALALDGQVFRVWDKRFGGIQDTTWLTEDEASPGNFYRTKVEWIGRSAGGDAYFDEVAKVYRVTTFYAVKINL